MFTHRPPAVGIEKDHDIQPEADQLCLLWSQGAAPLPQPNSRDLLPKSGKVLLSSPEVGAGDLAEQARRGWTGPYSQTLPICHVLSVGTDVLWRQARGMADQGGGGSTEMAAAEFGAVRDPQPVAEAGEGSVPAAAGGIP